MLLRSCHSRLNNVFALNSFGRLRPLSTVPVKKHPEFVVTARSESGSRRSRRLREGKHTSKGEIFKYFYNVLFCSKCDSWRFLWN
jgi:molybdenum cofactor biosynthesis enzyme MoaA